RFRAQTLPVLCRLNEVLVRRASEARPTTLSGVYRAALLCESL
ncbi:MAG: hypothetical protein ACI8PT_004834, partial [Gammaproteobacteria bacterium]